jgi:hypothetical protein
VTLLSRAPTALLALLLVALGVAGCESVPPAPPEQVLGATELSRTGGCGDAFIFATSADETIALTVNWAQAASRAQVEGGWSDTVALPHADVTVGLQYGRHLSEGFCTDVIMPDRPLILGEVPATQGEVGITLQPAPGAQPFMPLANATVRLSNVVFEVPLDEGVELWRIESLELTNIAVGWLAG